MKVLITNHTVAGGKPVFAGEVHDVSKSDALILRECGKATSDPKRIAAREAELAVAPVVETAEAKPAVETAAKKSAKAAPKL